MAATPKTISTDNAAKVLGEVTDLFEDAVSYFRSKRLDRAAECAALYRGWHQFARDGVYQLSITDPTGESAETLPLARMLTKAAVAATMRQQPVIEIAAAKSDQRARARADSTERLAQNFLRTKLDREELHRAVSWAHQTGASWLKVCWDLNVGKVVPSPMGGFSDAELEHEAESQDDGFGNSIAPSVYEGDIRCEFVPTTDGLPDPTARSRAEVQHFFHVKLLPVRKLMDQFPTDYFGESTKGKWGVGPYSQEQISYATLADDLDFPSRTGQTRRAEDNTLAELVEFWELPTRRFPQGRFVAYSDKLILAMGPNPYYPARLPFVLIQGDNLVPGSLYADGLLEDVKGLQYSTNRVLSKMREWMDKMLNSHLLVPHGAGIDKNIWGDKPGQIIGYQRGYKPEALQAPDIPVSMFTYLDEQVERAKMVTGYSDVGRGDAQPDLSGRAVAFYTENEQSMREPYMASYRTALIEISQQAIYLIRQFYDDGRMIAIVGENGRVELQEFMSDNYDWGNDLLPEAYDGRPQSHAAKVSEVLEFLGATLFEDAPGAERARALLSNDYAYLKNYEPFPEDAAKSKRENLSVLNDPMPALQVQTFDTHRIHLREHYKFMRTLEFEELPDFSKQLLFQHTELHELMARAAGVIGHEEGMPINPAGMPPPPGQPPGQPGAESPMSGGAPQTPAPAPSVGQFAQMDSTAQKASDQK